MRKQTLVNLQLQILIGDGTSLMILIIDFFLNVQEQHIIKTSYKKRN